VSVGVSDRCQVGISRAVDSIHVNSTAISASGLRKAYGDKTILDDTDLAIGAGIGIVDQLTGWVR
jgi:ABC-2 type transport system ATP-binding protein